MDSTVRDIDRRSRLVTVYGSLYDLVVYKGVLSVSDFSIAYIVLAIDFISTLYMEVFQKRGNR